ncbi:MAG: serine/threonine protein kinase, partial [bacterium]|nr:serine/threonine protein kinase [bacterium]
MGELNNKTVVNSWNEFDPLKHIILGRADYCCIPWPEPALDAKVPEDSDMKGMNGPRPQASVEKANELLDNYAKILEKRGIRVDRPTPLQWNQAIGTPDWKVNSMFGCMPARDILLTVGKEILEATMSYRCRFFEYLAYRPLLQSYF